MAVDPLRIPHKNGDLMVEITQENYESLRKAYLKAFKTGDDMFSWKDIEITTLFAGYCLEYMESHSHIKKK